ncbi:MAG TPA: EAL domain-containing protein [Piscinibacter sp.]|mgnify:FL=1|jgi:PAS domain S-box-containing protein|uniref:putative bifunctional diguanylate cyclase/phosphodiesterase n=1 Tax=Piscinibacter sp. TaxID=1903157 RepID=UPI001B7B5FB7|nr:EAL domain-containing protein [Piscinibacter sp.]MBK7529354.1 EAL domain-containing protein [Piscinibacter sp.]MBP6541603.1 EAL domain-containing protein [Piscinibacter sp.]HOY34976.1 EAL domain-containing protein [Piscinibacter sp.]HPG78024.1 EAL domain-containing protein [Piscinibacter sp.]HPM65105.1 EAL domain-containing protein [Piscinibacter sp.]
MSKRAVQEDDDLPRQPKVLLVDDDEVNLLLTSIALRERGFDITEANGGEQAIRMLADWLPDVVVLDALMPGLDGFETCRELRHLPGFESLPVLMLTGLDDDASITRAYEAGATDFFVKSTQWSLLAGRLRYLLRSARTRQELERNKSRLARAQDLARMGSFDWKRGDGGPIFSPEGLRVFGLAPDESLPFRTLLRMLPSEDRNGLLTVLREVLKHSSVLATDVPVTLLDGRQRIVHVEAEPEFNEHGNLIGYTGIVQDVTDRRMAEDKIKHLANFDGLTGLPNRRQLIWRTERALEHARRLGHQVALLLIDLDRFKVINDTLGHGAGDELLMEVSRRLRSCVRHSDQVMESSLEAMGSRSHRTLEAVGRLGGDEFVALLPEVADERDAERVAKRILDLMREPIFVGGQECFVTASVGIALYPRDGATMADVLRNADVAMYAVKSSGRNSSSLYSPALAGKGREKLELESALHKAIERNELVLHYQPKIDVRGARMVGAEALMRWQRGGVLVPPADFIPLAEETGLIIPLSEWAIREAARQARIWQDSFGFADSIAVNLPNRLFERTDLVEHIHNAVTTYGVPHHAIQLEITETGLMKDLQNVIPSLHRLNEIGVEISIDDFGTGYSSLAYLTTLPISELKIDRSFVRDLGMTPQSSAVVTAIIALARSLGLRVIAEGVENLRQMEVLHRLGCGIMQGYLFSRPQPPEDIETWLQQTVLPRKAPWIGKAGEMVDLADALRPADSRDGRLKPAG